MIIIMQILYHIKPVFTARLADKSRALGIFKFVEHIVYEAFVLLATKTSYNMWWQKYLFVKVCKVFYFIVGIQSYNYTISNKPSKKWPEIIIISFITPLRAILSFVYQQKDSYRFLPISFTFAIKEKFDLKYNCVGTKKWLIGQNT